MTATAYSETSELHYHKTQLNSEIRSCKLEYWSMLRLHGTLLILCMLIYSIVVHMCSATSNKSGYFNESSLSPLKIWNILQNGISVPCYSASCICKRWTGVSEVDAVLKPNNNFLCTNKRMQIFVYEIFMCTGDRASQSSK